MLISFPTISFILKTFYAFNFYHTMCDARSLQKIHVMEMRFISVTVPPFFLS